MSVVLHSGDTLEVRAWTKLGDQAAVNVTHWNVAVASGGPVDDSDVASSFAAGLAPLYKPILCNDAFFQGVVVQRISPLPLPVAVGGGSATAGTGGALALPKQTAGLISWTTNFAGRSQRGRIYLPFPSASHNQLDGFPTVAYKAGLSALLNFYAFPDVVTTGPGSVSLNPVIWHRATRTFDQITFAFISTLWATQRRRGSFGRINTSPI